MDRLPFSLPDFLPGHVWLVGAGPGDPGLLSLLALHALTHADVIVYDALVDPRVMALANAGAILEFAGKRGGKPSAKQPDISNRLVILAREGNRVLRLKGGDPFVFGRGAEEALTLSKAAVPFRVVPGITSGIGGLAYAGIPATSRETNSAIAFVTGHDASGDVPDSVDWEHLAKAVPVLVFYMALKHLDRIASRLVAAGRRPDEPAAVVSRASTPQQRVVVGTLNDIALLAQREGIEPPALVVVGEVVRLRQELNWQITFS
ncbi:uroporphyrinogen-III C-methyltransferase [Telmatospirillum siberiense]|uniref:uroporphyrinogen-III C-methyltransferase n=1 Tax=Telmatospirillum siberiense TaxID=382514 RepID=A0A2N3PSJ9_9PROT|nr:uroporphyrinogen-III C-methyltransferase [Telmatospirillum siberiense]PKU23380.1 uroporphyrinogen-III C-methyltransferase [Telmatospirillum siberiense]